MDPDRDEVVVSRGRLGLGEGVGGWDQIEPTCGMFTQQQCCGNVGRSWIAGIPAVCSLSSNAVAMLAGAGLQNPARTLTGQSTKKVKI